MPIKALIDLTTYSCHCNYGVLQWIHSTSVAYLSYLFPMPSNEHQESQRASSAANYALSPIRVENSPDRAQTNLKKKTLSHKRTETHTYARLIKSEKNVHTLTLLYLCVYWLESLKHPESRIPKFGAFPGWGERGGVIPLKIPFPAPNPD